jgi:uncharacterized protein with NRDE domain
MCVLILQHRLVPGYPVLVAANRDEARNRPSDPPAIWPEGFLAPRDRRAGGTWIGVNRHGVFVGITNRTGEPLDPARPSRGLIVTTALGAPTARAAVARVERAAFSEPQNPFNLLIADLADAFVLTGGEAVRSRALPPGTHVLTNEHEIGALDLGDLTPPADVERALAALAATCRDHGTHGYAPCKHGEHFGTVSSMLIALGGGPAHPDRIAYGDGLPCRVAPVEVGPALRAFRRPR